VITIGVDDLEASLRFYREGLGFPTEGIVGKTVRIWGSCIHSAGGLASASQRATFLR
jgi:catechol 2,3-dioxygenase-like lactoylglutathione lyase family enzyme